MRIFQSFSNLHDRKCRTKFDLTVRFAQKSSNIQGKHKTNEYIV